jgi:tetratricopeptide (TPR) repeat protein
MTRKRRRWLGLGSAPLVSALLLLWSSPVLAQSSPDDLARRHFESGVAYLEESDYENALAAFRKAHELSPRPEILLNIATVHERLGQLPDAVTALRRYLAAAPNGEHAETVRRRVENLEKRIGEASPSPAEAPPPAPAAASPPPAPPPVAPPPVAPPPVASSPEAKASRVPAFVALGVGAAGVVGAVVTGILAKGEYDDAEKSCKPACTDDELASGRGLALTSTILTGVAVAGVGVGVTLLLLEPGKSDAPGASMPRLQLGVRATPSGPTVAGELRF